MDILDDMGESKLSAKVFFFKVNYSFKETPKNVLYSPSYCSKHVWL